VGASKSLTTLWVLHGLLRDVFTFLSYDLYNSDTLYADDIEDFTVSLVPQTILPPPEIGTSSVNWVQLSRILPENGDRIQSPKCCVLNINRTGFKTNIG
jgi:hypothetical protein